MTMLRDPVQRVLSLYDYERRYELSRDRMKDVSLSEFVTSEDSRRTIHNFQTRLLGHPGERTPRIATPDTLAMAKRNLADGFAVFGLTERFDESVLLMRRALEWRHWPFYERGNVAADRPALSDLPDGLVASITERNELDIELHAWATERFDVTVGAAGAAFGVEVAMFRLMNSDAGRRFRAGVLTTRHRAIGLPRRVGRAVRRNRRPSVVESPLGDD